MSVKQMGIVWELDLAPNKRLVLLAYADHADDDGDNVYPSLERVARKTGYSKDQARRISRDLVADGLMELVEKGVGRGNTHRYRLTLENGSKLQPFEPRQEKVASRREKVASANGKGGTAMQPEPSVKNHQEPSNSPRGSAATSNPIKDRITLLVDRCREMDFYPTPTQKDSWANELTAKSRRSLPSREFMLLVNQIVGAAADGYYWSFSRAERELGTPRGKTSMGETPEAKGTPPEIIEYVFANTRTPTIKDNEPRIRRVLSRFDFTSGETPPFPVQAELGGTDNERWQMMDALNSICKRAVRETRGAA